MSDAGILRYGFHGLSYDYIAGVLPAHLGARAEGRVIVAHLGNGASMCAMKARRSVATSMGFTALDGLMMGQRCGALDPGVVLYLLNAEGHDAARNHASSLQRIGSAWRVGHQQRHGGTGGQWGRCGERGDRLVLLPRRR